MKWMNLVTLGVLILGGLNWLAVAIGGPSMDLAASLFGSAEAFGARALYGLVGLAALWQLIPFVRAWRLDEASAEAGRHATAR